MYQETHNISFSSRYAHIVCRYDKNDKEIAETMETHIKYSS